MFQTEPIIYLQSFSTQWLTFLMILITTMGNPTFVFLVVFISIFGIDFKRGFLLFQLVLWTGLVTDFFKILVAFPRPDFVDNRVHNLEFGTKNTSPFIGKEPEDFFALPNKKILDTFHLQKAFNFNAFGFPSGHVALTASLWGGSATVFKNKIIMSLTPFAIVIVALSRVYLGRHFIGDILGGAILGLIFLYVFSYFLKSSLSEDFFKKESYELAFRRQNILFYCFMFVIPIIFISMSIVDTSVAGLYIGTNVAYLLILRKGIPEDTGNIKHRITRVFISLCLFAVSSYIIGYWSQTSGMINQLQFTIVFLNSFIPAITIWATVSICKKLDLY